MPSSCLCPEVRLQTSNTEGFKFNIKPVSMNEWYEIREMAFP